MDRVGTCLPATQTPARVAFHQPAFTRRFGVELEVNAGLTPGAKNDLEAIRKIVAGADQAHDVRISNKYIQDYANPHWHVKFDRSCKNSAYNYGWEVASYVATGRADLDVIRKVTGELRAAGLSANRRCSVHVHAEIADHTADDVSRLLARWLQIESVLVEAVPEHRTTGMYSKPLAYRHRDWFSPSAIYEPWDFFLRTAPKPYPQHYTGWRPRDRRTALNITNYMKGVYQPEDLKVRRTVELRLPEGSLDPDTVANWVILFLRFVDRSFASPFPQPILPLGLYGALTFLGLHGTSEEPVILSPELVALKTWLLERVVAHSRREAFRREAVNGLNRMWKPIRSYAVPGKGRRPARQSISIS